MNYIKFTLVLLLAARLFAAEAEKEAFFGSSQISVIVFFA